MFLHRLGQFDLSEPVSRSLKLTQQPAFAASLCGAVRRGRKPRLGRQFHRCGRKRGLGRHQRLHHLSVGGELSISLVLVFFETHAFLPWVFLGPQNQRRWWGCLGWLCCWGFVLGRLLQCRPWRYIRIPYGSEYSFFSVNIKKNLHRSTQSDTQTNSLKAWLILP